MFQASTEPIAFDVEVVLRLKIQPEPLARPEVPGEPQSGVSRDPPLTVHDLIDPSRRDTDIGGPPLLVNSDAVLPRTVTVQPLEAVARWNTQVIEPLGRIKHPEFSQRSSLQISGQSWSVPAVEQPFSGSTPKAPNHSNDHNGHR